MIDFKDSMAKARKAAAGLVNSRPPELMDLLLRWFFAQVGYTLLPIGVIIAIRVCTDRNLGNLYLAPEWSFATIVFVGTAITEAIELKIEHQRDFSHRVYSLTRVLTLVMIASVIVLSLVVLRQEGIPVNEPILFRCQLVLLGVSLLFLFAAYSARDQVVTQQARRPSSLETRVYRKSLYGSFAKAIDELAYIRWALVDPPSGAFQKDVTGTWKQENQNKIEMAISNLKQHLAMIEECWKKSPLYAAQK